MSKRGDPASIRTTRVKKRKGVGSRTIIVPDSDEENPVPNEFAQVTRTRVATSGKAEKVSMTSVPMFDDKKSTTHTLQEENTVNSMDAAAENVVSVVPAKQRKRANDSTKMQTWLDVRPSVLDEMVHLDGPGDHQLDLCSSCSSNKQPLLYRCLECSYPLLHCRECVVKLHKVLPLHRLECWQNGFFNRSSLHSLGLVCNLGHNGDPCPLGSSTHILTVIDINGWHRVQVRFCACDPSTPWRERYRQLIRMRWYPASFNRPQTAFSFDLLDTYHKLTLQGKLNLYDFYHAIMRKSDNQGQLKKMYQYHEISRCVRQWRHLKGVKRGGGAHQTSLSMTKPGSFAIECPACPHPSWNLPENWDTIVDARKWLYAQFIAVDANFRLKLKNRKIKDPELRSGWSYFVENSEYVRHVANAVDEDEVTSCGSEFHAVNQANTRGGKDYIASGVVKAVCAHHCFVLPTAVGDLQRGERYINTDYIIAAYLRCCRVSNIKISYDIACKWSINFHTRFKTSHEDVELSKLSITHLVPKFHLPAHGPKCQVEYSFNYTQGVGRTHGETVEQEWAYINLAALSTREMGPGARHSTLDDNWGGWNWNKVLGFGPAFEMNLIKAVEMASMQRRVADDFTATFSSETVDRWRKMVEEWQIDRSRPNPYVSHDRGSKLSEIRLRLAQDEAAEAERGQHAPHMVSAPVFVRMGLELEDQQYSLLSKSAGKTRSDGEKAALLEKRGVLLHKIEKWRRLQAVYMPGLPDAEPYDTGSSQKMKAELTKLWLPSQLDRKDRDALCPGGIVSSETELRFAQLEDALNDLRRARRVRRGLITFHKVQLVGEGQRIQTKSRSVMQTVQDRINKFSRRYRVAHEALMSLDPNGNWKILYPPLTDNDNRGPGKEPEEKPGSDGQYSPSWIWRSNTGAVSQDEVNNDMRVEWAQCVARAERWEEGKLLLQEEMRRVVEFLEWRSLDWLSKVGSRSGTVSPEVHAGLSAYAKKQSAVFHNLTVRFCQRWRSMLISLSLPHVWATHFLETHKEPLENPDFKKRKTTKDHQVKAPSQVSAPTGAQPPPDLETTGCESGALDTKSDGSVSDNYESGSESTDSLED